MSDTRRDRTASDNMRKCKEGVSTQAAPVAELLPFEVRNAAGTSIEVEIKGQGQTHQGCYRYRWDNADRAHGVEGVECRMRNISKDKKNEMLLPQWI